MGVAEIVLTRGKVALVDSEDIGMLSTHMWHARVTKSGIWYAQRSYSASGVTGKLAMHCAVLRLPPGSQVDHINGNGLDNRKLNLREATSQQNNRNKRKSVLIAGHPPTSVFKGVNWHKASSAWIVRIRTAGKHMYIGTFESEIEAALAYDSAARIHHREFAALNFPVGGERCAL